MSCFIAVFLLFASLYAEPMVVKKIEIQNRKYTQEWVILRELQFAVGDTVDEAKLNQARLRILNVDVFHEVAVSTDSSGIVIINLDEAWHIFPVLNFAFAEGQLSEVLDEPSTFLDKVIVTTGMVDFNFRGNGAKAYAEFQFGAADGFAVGYSSRWLSPKLPYAIGAGFQSLRISDRHASVKDSSRHLRNLKANFTLATRGGAKSRLGLEFIGQNLRRIETYDKISKLKYNQIWLNPFAVIDHRDLEWYPSRGVLVSTQADFAFGTKNFSRWNFDLRHYIPLTNSQRPPLIALRGNYATSSNSTPYWAHYYHGFSRGFRGYETVKSESGTFISGEAELRFPITKESQYDVPFLGALGRHWPFGINGEVFLQKTELQFSGKRSELLGYGFGALIRVPFFQILESAFTFDKEGNFSTNLGTGINF